MIKVKNLKKNYDDFEAVRGIDFDVSEGEVFGLLGPNGAGKTTTVEILEGLIEPSSGTATISDLDVVKNSKIGCAAPIFSKRLNACTKRLVNVLPHFPHWFLVKTIFLPSCDH